MLIPKINDQTNNLENKIEEKKEIDPTSFTLGNKEYNFDIIRKPFEETKNTPTAMLEYILNIVEKDKINKKEEKFGIIRNNNEIEDLITEIDIELKKSKSNEDYFNSSLLLQNLISNSIRKEILIYENNEILPKSLNNCYIDILVDISQMMIDEQKIAALIISTGLCISFSFYGIKIRISVFGERKNVWELSKNFSDDNKDIYTQLSKLRDALSCSKRIQSFPADALKALKKSFDSKNFVNCGYSQILISSLISPQVIDKSIDWNNINGKVIIFGLESTFEKKFIEKHPKFENE